MNLKIKKKYIGALARVLDKQRDCAEQRRGGKKQCGL